MNKYIEIVECESKKVIRRFDVTKKSSSYIDGLEDGLLQKLDDDKFYVQNSKSHKELECL